MLDGLDAALDTALAAPLQRARAARRGRQPLGGRRPAAPAHPARRPGRVAAYITRSARCWTAIEAAPCLGRPSSTGYALAGGCEIIWPATSPSSPTRPASATATWSTGCCPARAARCGCPARCPAALARRLLYTGEIVDGATAAAWGLASHLAARGELDAAVDALVARLARHSPDALARMKAMYRDRARRRLPPRWPPSSVASSRT